MELITLYKSSSICNTLINTSDTFEYICSFNRRLITNRTDPILTKSEKIEQVLQPTCLFTFLFFNAYVISLYEKNYLLINRLASQIGEKKQKTNTAKWLFLESENLLLDLSLSFCEILYTRARQEQCGIGPFLEKNYNLLDQSAQYITTKLDLAIRNNMQKDIVSKICANINLELNLIHYKMSEHLLSTDLRKEVFILNKLLNESTANSTKYKSIQQSINEFNGIIEIDNAIFNVRRLDYENSDNNGYEKKLKRKNSNLKILINPIANGLTHRKIYLDDYYDHVNENLTEKGKDFMKYIISFGEKMVTRFYNSNEKSECSICKDTHDSRMLFSIEYIYAHFVSKLEKCLNIMEKFID